MLAWFAWVLFAASPAAGMVFPYWIAALLALTPLWMLGIALLAAGRTGQRGPVKGSIPAWILALGALPAIGVLLGATMALASCRADAATSMSFAALLVSIPLLTVLALMSGAWLTWGKPRTG